MIVPKLFIIALLFSIISCVGCKSLIDDNVRKLLDIRKHRHGDRDHFIKHNTERRTSRNSNEAIVTCGGTSCSTDLDCFDDITDEGVITVKYCGLNDVCATYGAAVVPLGGACNASIPYDLVCAAGGFCTTGVCRASQSSGCTSCTPGNVNDCTLQTVCSGHTCLPYRLNGESCTSFYQCLGDCVGGVCVQSAENGICAATLGCQDGLFCNGLCTPTNQLCNLTNPYGYCPPKGPGRSEGVCYEGQFCLSLYGLIEGDPCVPMESECIPTLGCRLNEEGSEYECAVPLNGSMCDSSDWCSYYQSCMCQEGASSPTCQSLIEPPPPECESQYTDLLSCVLQCNIDISIAVRNYTCVTNCESAILAYECCTACPSNSTSQYYANVAGTCATNLQNVDCCNTYSYCTNETYAAVCAAPVPTSSTSTLTLTTSTTSKPSSTTTSSLSSSSTSTSKSTSSSSTATSTSAASSTTTKATTSGNTTATTTSKPTSSTTTTSTSSKPSSSDAVTSSPQIFIVYVIIAAVAFTLAM